MELTGEENRIRALFSEVKFADEQIAPSFASVWHRAQAHSMKPRRAFNLSFALATALLIFTLASLALWSKYSQRPLPASALANIPAPSFVRTTIDKDPQTTGTIKDRLLGRPNSARSAQTRRQALLLAANRKAAREARAIASWKSPTESLLSSSSDELFKSLPQLTENANELKSFLPSRVNDKEK